MELIQFFQLSHQQVVELVVEIIIIHHKLMEQQVAQVEVAVAIVLQVEQEILPL